MKHPYPDELLRALYRSPKDPSLWEELRRQATDVRRWLETAGEAPEFPSGEGEEAELDPAVTAGIYEALAPAGELAQQSLGTHATLLVERDREDREIGRAFKEELLAGLPGRLQDLDAYFVAAPVLPEKEQQDLLATADVQAALPEAAPLARHGLSPVRTLYATKGVVSLAERLMRHNLMPQGPAFVLLGPEEPASPGKWPVLPDEHLEEEIALATRCGPTVALLLRAWLVEVAQFKPYLFPGGVAEPAGRSVVIRPDQETNLSVAQRWGLSCKGSQATRDSP